MTMRRATLLACVLAAVLAMLALGGAHAAAASAGGAAPSSPSSSEESSEESSSGEGVVEQKADSSVAADAAVSKVGSDLAVGSEGQKAVERLAAAALEGFRAVLTKDAERAAAAEFAAGEESSSEAAEESSSESAAAEQSEMQRAKAAAVRRLGGDAAAEESSSESGSQAPAAKSAQFKGEVARRLAKAAQQATLEAHVLERRAQNALQRGVVEASAAQLKTVHAAATSYKASEAAAKKAVLGAHDTNAARLQKEVEALSKARGASRGEREERDLDVEELRRLLAHERKQKEAAARQLAAVHAEQLRLLQQYEAMVTTLSAAWKSTEKRLASGLAAVKPQMAQEDAKVRAALAKADAVVRNAGAFEGEVDARARDTVRNAAGAKVNEMEARIRRRMDRKRAEDAEAAKVNEMLERQIVGGKEYKGRDLLAVLRRQALAEKRLDRAEGKQEKVLDAVVNARHLRRAQRAVQADGQGEGEGEGSSAGAGDDDEDGEGSREKIPYSYVAGEAKRTALDNAEVDMVARLVLRQGRRHRCDKTDEWCQLTWKDGQLREEDVAVGEGEGAVAAPGL